MYYMFPTWIIAKLAAKIKGPAHPLYNVTLRQWNAFATPLTRIIQGCMWVIIYCQIIAITLIAIRR